MHRLARSLARIVVVALFASTAHAQETSQELRAQIDALKRRLAEIEAELAEVQREAGKATEQVELGDVPPSVIPPRNITSNNPNGVSRIRNQPPPTNPELKGFVPIPGTKTSFRLGGYAKLDAIYDNHAAGDTDAFVPINFPVGQANQREPNFTMHARQTQFNLEVRRPSVLGTNLRFYFEFDFFGGGNGDYAFSLRQAYGQIGNTWAGFGYSAFMDADALPDTLDFEGPGGALFLFQAGVHQAFELGAGTSLWLALENPSSQITDVFDSSATGTQRLPDGVIRLRTEHHWGHVQLATLLRRLSYETATAKDDTFGGGPALTGAIKTFGRDLFFFSGAWGNGIARYVQNADQGTSNQNLDAVVENNGSLKALEIWGAYAAYQHYWTPDWSSNLVYGAMQLQRSQFLPDTFFKKSTYGALNLIWKPASTFSIGLELLHGTLDVQNGEKANDTRVQGSIQYKFVD